MTGPHRWRVVVRSWWGGVRVVSRHKTRCAAEQTAARHKGLFRTVIIERDTP